MIHFKLGEGMAEVYDAFLIYAGQYFSVYFHAEGKDRSQVYDYFEACDDATQATLLYLAKRMADHGRIYDQTKFNIESREHKIYAFKAKNDRFFCFFFAGRKIIVTSAYRKQRQKLDRQELQKAITIQQMYL
jgi:hypothetical protein